MGRRSLASVCLSFTLFSCLCAHAAQPSLPDARLTQQEEAEVRAMVLPVPPAWKGDLDGMRERRLVRILVPYSRTFFAVDRG